MIANISKAGSSFLNVAQYNQNKVDKGQGEIIDSRMVLNTHPRQVDKGMKLLSSNSRVSKPVFHVSLSFSPDERAKINNELLKKVGREYLEKMGYGKQPYIMYRHDDTKHPHIHILSTRVNIETKAKIRDNFERYRSQGITSGMELKYNLVFAHHRTKTHTKIKEDVGKALKNAPATNKQLNKVLQQNGSPYRIKTAGKGIVYHKVDGLEKRNSKSWKGSEFKGVGLDKKGLEQAYDYHKYQRTLIKAAINNSLQGKEKITLANFEKALSKSNVTPHYSINSGGIYGISFEYKDLKLKASDIDRNLSWNKLKDRIVVPEYVKTRELLNQSIRQGNFIGTKLETGGMGKVTFTSPNKALEQELNSMRTWDAFKLRDLNNKYVEQLDKANDINQVKLIKNFAEDDIDERLQRQYEMAQRQHQRELKIRR